MPRFPSELVVKTPEFREPQRQNREPQGQNPHVCGANSQAVMPAWVFLAKSYPGGIRAVASQIVTLPCQSRYRLRRLVQGAREGEGHS